jgi:type II secretory pathway predicted ATPase ExeA
MLTEVMRFYGLTRPPIDAGFFETEHHTQVSRDIHAAIVGGRLIALTAIIGSGKTILSRRLRSDLEKAGSSCRVRCRSTRRRSPCRC